MKIYQVDTFTDEIFSGNPAAVCPLKEWISGDMMLSIASENNLSETAFYIKRKNDYHIRWFTPKGEVELCGHATLATAFVIYHFENYQERHIVFHSEHSGKLIVSKQDDLFTLDFPSDPIYPVDLSVELLNCFSTKPKIVYQGKTDYMMVFENESEIKTIVPNLQQIVKLDIRGIIITARGTDADFVSRFFAPACGVDEDPVCGSAHTTLIPYWAEQLNKTELFALQLSERTGKLYCKYKRERVEISGKAKLYMKGEIFI